MPTIHPSRLPNKIKTPISVKMILFIKLFLSPSPRNNPVSWFLDSKLNKTKILVRSSAETITKKLNPKNNPPKSIECVLASNPAFLTSLN